MKLSLISLAFASVMHLSASISDSCMPIYDGFGTCTKNNGVADTLSYTYEQMQTLCNVCYPDLGDASAPGGLCSSEDDLNDLGLNFFMHLCTCGMAMSKMDTETCKLDDSDPPATDVANFCSNCYEPAAAACDPETSESYGMNMTELDGLCAAGPCMAALSTLATCTYAANLTATDSPSIPVIADFCSKCYEPAAAVCGAENENLKEMGGTCAALECLTVMGTFQTCVQTTIGTDAFSEDDWEPTEAQLEAFCPTCGPAFAASLETGGVCKGNEEIDNAESHNNIAKCFPFIVCELDSDCPLGASCKSEETTSKSAVRRRLFFEGGGVVKGKCVAASD